MRSRNLSFTASPSHVAYRRVRVAVRPHPSAAHRACTLTHVKIGHRLPDRQAIMSDQATRPDIFLTLQSCRLWHTASDEAVLRLVTRAFVQEVRRGAVLATEGDPEAFRGIALG